MFTSAGYFRGLNCPYFGSGLCERPYCHFRHVKDSGDKPEDKSGTVTSTAGPPTGPTSKSLRSEPVSDDFGFQKSLQNRPSEVVEFNKYTGEPIRNSTQEQGAIPSLSSIKINKYTGEPVSKSVSHEEYKIDSPVSKYPQKCLNGSVKYNKYTGEPIVNENKTDQYTVEPVKGPKVVEFNKYTGEPIYAKVKQQNVPVIDKKYAGNVPSYNPTPLNELKKRPINKYALALYDNAGAEEYDPESNYSTVVTGESKINSQANCYDPSNSAIGPSANKSENEFQFDISQFSDDDDEEDEEKSRFAEDFTDDKSDDGFQVKDAEYFESLLDRRDSVDTDMSDEPGKYFFSNTTDKAEVSTSLVNRFKAANDKINKSSKTLVRSTNDKSKKDTSVSNKIQISSSNDRKSLKRSLSTNSQDEKTDSKKSRDSENHEKLKDKNVIKKGQGLPHQNDKSDLVNHKSDKQKLSSGHEKSSSNTKSSSSSINSSSKESVSSIKHKSPDSHNSSSSSHHKSSSKKHSSSDSHKSSSNSHKSSDIHKSSSSHKSSSGSHKSSGGHHSSSGGHKLTSGSSHNKSSSKTSSSGSSKSSHHNHKSDKENKLKNHVHKNSERTSESNTVAHHKDRTSSSEDSDRRKSVDDNARKKILDLNVDLFGEDSDDEVEGTNRNGNMDYASDSSSSHDDFVEVGSDIELSDNDTYEECFKIFKENSSSAKSSKKAAKKKKSLEESLDPGIPAIVAKKRKAHATEKEIQRKLRGTPITKLSPAQVMHNRFLQIQEKALKEAAMAAAAQAATSKSNVASNASSSASSSLSNSSKLKRKHSTEPVPSTSNSAKVSSKKSEQEKFVIATASKTEKRKAHVPDVIKTNLKRPTIPSEFGSKVPSNVRQRYLNLIIDECLKLCNNEEQAYKRGQEEEQAVYQRSSSRKVYLNVVVNTIKKLRTEISQKSSSNSKKVKESPLKIAHETILGGKNATKTTFTLNRSGGGAKTITENFKGTELFNRLSKYILTEEQLKENGFPFPSTENPGSAIFYTDKGVQMSQKTSLNKKPVDYEKICVRCGKRFIVYPNGKYAHIEECNYHWGKAWKKRIAGAIDTRYTCCQGDFNSDGCQFAKQHVHETNKYENLSGYMKTLPCSPPPDGDYGIYAMDCEMVYTLAGVELARVTVVDPSNEPIYETLVKPDRTIIDFNTKFSGITEEDMKGVTTTIRDVQAVLLSLFTDNTIIIGHSLESDLSAVKLIHKTVVDTSVVFPHRLGPPFKRALKTLMAEYMQKIIQDDVGGHDSLEDAVSCMELMHYKIREDARRDKHS